MGASPYVGPAPPSRHIDGVLCMKRLIIAVCSLICSLFLAMHPFFAPITNIQSLDGSAWFILSIVIWVFLYRILCELLIKQITLTQSTFSRKKKFTTGLIIASILSCLLPWATLPENGFDFFTGKANEITGISGEGIVSFILLAISLVLILRREFSAKLLITILSLNVIWLFFTIKGWLRIISDGIGNLNDVSGMNFTHHANRLYSIDIGFDLCFALTALALSNSWSLLKSIDTTAEQPKTRSMVS